MPEGFFVFPAVTKPSLTKYDGTRAITHDILGNIEAHNNASSLPFEAPSMPILLYPRAFSHFIAFSISHVDFNNKTFESHENISALYISG